MKVGVIGVGSMGQNHARIYSEMGNLVGVYDVFAEQSKKIASRLNVQWHSSIDSLLKEVDAVSIATPTSTHFENATKALDAGVSCLVEKPFTGDPSNARKLCEAAEKEAVIISPGFVERFNPVVGAAKESLAEGRFGKLVSISTRRVSTFPSRIRDVGVIMDLGIHDIDVVRYITGAEITSVYAMGGKMANPSFEDHAEMLGEIEGGVIGLLETNWLTPMKVRKVSMTCSEGYVQLDYMDQTMEISSSRFKELDLANMSQIPMELDVRRISLKKEEPLKRELESFAKAVEAGSKPEVTGWDALSNLCVCAAASKSLREGKRVPVPKRD